MEVGKELPSADGLREWFQQSEYATMGYSDILAQITPSTEDRRSYLSKFFEGARPGQAQMTLASFVAQGLARVILTTNLDRLVEQTLQEHGITPVVVASDEDLNAVMPREHAQCWVVKLHGDYLRTALRNTPKEVKCLTPEMRSQFQEVADRYGLVVVGYAGNDPSIMDVLRARNSKYTMYWVVRQEPAPHLQELIAGQEGRFIKRKSASEIFSELNQKVALYTTYPTGDSPQAKASLTKTLIKNGDNVGFADLVRKSVDTVEKEWETLFESLQGGTTTPEHAVNALDSQTALLTATGLTLIYFAKEDWIGRLLDGIEQLCNIAHVELISTGEHRLEFITVPTATVLIPYVQWMALALIRERVDVVAHLCEASFTTPDGILYQLLTYTELIHPHALGQDAMIAWRHVLEASDRFDFLWEYFPDKTTYRRAISEAGFTMSLYAIAHKWEMPYPYFLRNSESVGHIRRLLSRLQARTTFTTEYLRLITSGTLQDFSNNWPNWADGLNQFDRPNLRGQLPTTLSTTPTGNYLVP